jgi:hypothetical protein
MTVSWPPEKREKLKLFLDNLFTETSGGRPCTPHILSRVLGLLRHAAPVAPLGTFRSLRLQHVFNDVVSRAPSRHFLRRW